MPGGFHRAAGDHHPVCGGRDLGGTAVHHLHLLPHSLRAEEEEGGAIRDYQ